MARARRKKRNPATTYWTWEVMYFPMDWPRSYERGLESGKAGTEQAALDAALESLSGVIRDPEKEFFFHDPHQGVMGFTLYGVKSKGQRANRPRADVYIAEVPFFPGRGEANNNPHQDPAFPMGMAPHVFHSEAMGICSRVHQDVLAAHPSVTVRECPSCGEETTQPQGACDFCTGEMRTVCRVCLLAVPGADWSEAEYAGRHDVPVGQYAGKVCPGSELPVALLENPSRKKGARAHRNPDFKVSYELWEGGVPVERKTSRFKTPNAFSSWYSRMSKHPKTNLRIRRATLDGKEIDPNIVLQAAKSSRPWFPHPVWVNNNPRSKHQIAQRRRVKKKRRKWQGEPSAPGYGTRGRKKHSQEWEEYRERELPTWAARHEAQMEEYWLQSVERARNRREKGRTWGKPSSKPKGKKPISSRERKKMARRNPYFRDAFAPSGKVWEHRRWHLPAGADRSEQPEVFYWHNLEDAFAGGDPQDEEDLVFKRTPQRGWRWSHADGMGGEFRHEATLVSKRARKNPKKARANRYMLPTPRAAVTEAVWSVSLQTPQWSVRATPDGKFLAGREPGHHQDLPVVAMITAASAHGKKSNHTTIKVVHGDSRWSYYLPADLDLLREDWPRSALVNPRAHRNFFWSTPKKARAPVKAKKYDPKAYYSKAAAMVKSLPKRAQREHYLIKVPDIGGKREVWVYLNTVTPRTIKEALWPWASTFPKRLFTRDPWTGVEGNLTGKMAARGVNTITYVDTFTDVIEQKIPLAEVQRRATTEKGAKKNPRGVVNPEVRPGDPNWAAYLAYKRGERKHEPRTRSEWEVQREQELREEKRIQAKARRGEELTLVEKDFLYHSPWRDYEWEDYLRQGGWDSADYPHPGDPDFDPRLKKGAKKNPRPSAVGIYQELLAHLRALQWVYWTTHWTSAGPNFYGDHLLLQRLYEGKEGGPEINEEIDQLGERMVAYFGPGSVDPNAINKRVQKILDHTGDLSPMARLYALEDNLQRVTKTAWDAEQKAGNERSLGIDDYLMSLANERDTARYLLKQRLGGTAKANPRKRTRRRRK